MLLCAVTKPGNTYTPNEATFSGITTMRSDYRASDKPQPPIPSFKPVLKYEPNTIQFDGRTTVAKAYRKWPVQKHETPTWAIQKKYERPVVSFQNASSYQVGVSSSELRS